MRQACLPLGAALLLSWMLLATMEPQHQESGEVGIEVPGGEGLRTSFSCHGRVQGYYADVETGCRLYHLCDDTGRQFTNACPNLTLFQQRMMICDHWYMVNCSASVVDYAANLLLGRRDQPFLRPEDHLHQQHLQYQQRKRIPLPVKFPYDNEQGKDDGEASDESSETSFIKPKSRPVTGQIKGPSTTSKRKSPVNSSKTLSFSITSLPSRGNSQSVSSEDNYYSSRRVIPNISNNTRSTYGSKELSETRSENRGKNNFGRTSSTVSAVFSSTELPRELFSISSLPTAATLHNFSDVSNRGHNLQLNQETGGPTTRTLIREPTPFQQTFSSPTNTGIKQNTVHVKQNSDIGQAYQEAQPFETSSPRIPNVPRTNFNSETPVVSSLNTQVRYADRTNPPSPTTANVPERYKSNPYFQDYFRSSSVAPTSSRPPVLLRTTTSIPPFQPAFNIKVDDDVDEHSGNRIEIILQDPRRMFFIPDSDLEFDRSLNTKNSTILVIPLPAPDHRHGGMRFRSYDKLLEGRNPQCPRCHPAFLFPGQCQPCVLIR
ncbi:uncharacterized protein js [Anabrus simplex]|uniref:uncharacterized protein js n=1 Tax=Anabrus simplex TaxID=316456 RepID=UPI0034DD7D3A